MKDVPEDGARRACSTTRGDNGIAGDEPPRNRHQQRQVRACRLCCHPRGHSAFGLGVSPGDDSADDGRPTDRLTTSGEDVPWREALRARWRGR